MRRRIIVGLLTLLIGATGVGITVVYLQLNQAFGRNEPVWVEPGTSLRTVLFNLKGEKLSIIDRAYVKFWSRDHSLQTGVYAIDPSWGLRQALDRFEFPSDTVPVNIVPGDNMYIIADKLERAKVTSARSFLAACRSEDMLKRFFGEGPVDRCEGYIVPETYGITPFQTGVNVLDVFADEFKKTFVPIITSAGLSPDGPTINRILTIASIVEKETGAAHERPVIAAVFLNRLIRGMKIQSDPTTIYGMWHRYDGNIRKSDLLEETPYNTYAIKALPPTPIASPSADAISAVLTPAQTDFLYFVAKGQQGEHYFSRTYDEHKKAVARYQLGQ